MYVLSSDSDDDDFPPITTLPLHDMKNKKRRIDEISNTKPRDKSAAPPLSPFFTQSTQIVGRSTARAQLSTPADSSESSPKSTVIVPASSPLRPEAQKPQSLSSLVAPRGTSFQPPRTAALSRPAKLLSAPLIEESSGDKHGPRNRSSYTVSGPPSNRDEHTVPQKQVDQPSVDSIPDSADEAPATPKKPRRRLIQGRPGKRQSSDFQTAKAKADVIELLSDSDNEEFAASEPTSPAYSTSPGQELINRRILGYLNDCNVIQLVSIAGVKEASAKAMLEHQPFQTLAAAQRVSIPGSRKSGKSARVAIGEDVVNAVRAYTRTLDHIDKIIRQCETRAVHLRMVTSQWNIDAVGKKQTLANANAHLLDPPLSKEPELMAGNCQMKSYQIYGLNWMYLLYEWGFGGILADDMGLGKTCQVVSLMCSLVGLWQGDSDEAEGDRIMPWPNLIVVPPSTLTNWQNEFKKFAPDLRVTTYSGSTMQRDMLADDILDDVSQHHVILTTYSQLGRKEDIGNLKKIKPVTAVFDEGHKLKNPGTKLYQDLSRIPAKWRLLLTGTPVQNNLMEMIGLLSFIQPSLFTHHLDELEALFAQKHSVADLSKGVGLHSERVGRARTILEPFILQRRKEQVLQDLPGKTRRVVLCDLGEDQRAVYQQYQKRYLKQAVDQTGGPSKKGRANDTNNTWMQLRKAAVHQLLFRRLFDDETCYKMARIALRSIPYDELRQDNLEHMAQELMNSSDFELHLWCRDYKKHLGAFDIPDGAWLQCGKVQQLMSLLRRYKKNGDRALVFTKFAKVIEILSECLQSKGVRYVALQGSTDVKERQSLIDEFSKNEDITVFLLTTGAGGTGINLTAANKVIVFDMSDNPQEDVQAENRAHRLGQTREVEVVRLVSRDTVEELIHKACLKKLELADKVTGWETADMDMEAEIRSELQDKVRRGEL